MDKAWCGSGRMKKIYKIGAVILKDKKTLLVKKFGGDILISPGGVREEGETPEQTLRRELREELDVELIDMEPFGFFTDKATYENAQIIMDTYIVNTKGKFTPKSEIEKIVWIGKDYEKQNIKIASILEKFIIPKLIKMGLM